MLSVLSILGVPSSDVPTGHTPAPFSGGPIRPVGCGNKALPKPILANCTDALAAGVPDLRGNWQSSAFRGTHHWERIEQCGAWSKASTCPCAAALIHDCCCRLYSAAAFAVPR
jgi:hypothetical protein